MKRYSYRWIKAGPGSINELNESGAKGFHVKEKIIVNDENWILMEKEEQENDSFEE